MYFLLSNLQRIQVAPGDQPGPGLQSKPHEHEYAMGCLQSLWSPAGSGELHLQMRQGPWDLLPRKLWGNFWVSELFWLWTGRQQLWSCIRTYLMERLGGEGR